MVNRCVVFGCGHTHKDGFALHTFPSNPSQSRLWNRFVAVTRKDWVTNSQHSRVCSAHFDPSLYCDSVRASFGYNDRRKVLAEGAVPTIHPRLRETVVISTPTKTTTKRTGETPAIRKRKHLETLKLAHLEHAEREQPVSVVEETPFSPVEAEPIETQTSTSSTQTSTNVQSKMVQTTIMGRDRGIQATTRMVSVATQTTSSFMQDEERRRRDREEEKYAMEVDVEEPAEDDPISDPDFIPEDEEMDEECEGDEAEETTPGADQDTIYGELKFIVFLSCLLELFSVCRSCGKKSARGEVCRLEGTMVCIRQLCELCGETWTWASQPLVRDTFAGNILLSASILFSGSTPTKALRMLTMMGVQVYHRNTFFVHQRKWLHQAVRVVFTRQQTELLESAPEDGMVIGGDGRCDSMGHSAKYGAYVAVDLERKKVVDLQIVQSNETGGAYHMELEGLKRVKDFLDRFGAKVRVLITDRHLSIEKWVRDNWDDLVHFFDIWHVGKGLLKKLEKLSKKKSCRIVSQWMKSILNHLYWCATSSHGNEEEALSKWKSLTRHIANLHDGHDGLFTECAHGPLNARRTKPWFRPGSEAYEEITKVIESKRLLKDVPRLSPKGQTSVVEGFNSLINGFAPKMYHFGYQGMKSRLQLAALHFNENSSRVQSTNADGALQFCMRFRKFRKGQATISKVMPKPTYGYAETVMKEVLLSMTDSNYQPLELGENPPTLASQYPRPDKAEAVRGFVSRFQ